MKPEATLVTGASGEVGAALVRKLAEEPGSRVFTTDLRPFPDRHPLPKNVEHLEGDILSETVQEWIFARRPNRIFHLAALLSTRAESAPEVAHRVNVEGSVRMLDAATRLAERGPVQFVFPSSIAVYGLPSLAVKEAAGPVKEDRFLCPATLYGAQKLYIEQYGAILERQQPGLDFRAARFPGLLSATTLPSGGTSDWAPEMIHAAASGKPFVCFVRPEARLPFSAMSTAVTGFLRLAAADKSRLGRTAYNLGGPSLSAEEVARRVREDFPDLDHRFEPDPKRDRIVASWPAEVDDSAARRDFDWVPDEGSEALFAKYLIPKIRKRYELPASSITP